LGEGWCPSGGAVPCPRVTPEVPPVPHPLARHEQWLDICFPNYYQVSIDVTAGWAAFPGSHLTVKAS